MKLFLSTLTLLAMSTAAFSQDSRFQTEFLAKWKNSRDYTLQVARLMPEDQYAYRPFAEAKSFGEQMVHISEAMIYHAGLALPLNDQRAAPNPTKREAVVLHLQESYALVERLVRTADADDWEERVKFWDGPTSRRKLLNFTVDHITHHRGQAVVSLRMKGIKPPNYIGW